MKAAMLRYLDGKAVRFPFDVRVHMVAATYGQDPRNVREWPADVFRAAENYMPVTRGR